MKEKDYWELMYNISIASFISLLMFLIIWYFSTLPTFKSSIGALNNQTVSLLIFVSFLLILALPYRIKIVYAIISGDTLTNTLTTLEEFHTKKKYPFIIMGIGYSLLLISFLVVLNIPLIAIISPTMYGVILIALGFGFILIPIGLFSLIVCLSVKKYLEGQVSFTLKKANKIFDEILGQVENKNKIDSKNLKELKRYIYLTYKNIAKKMGKVSTSDLEYTLNYLPCYIKLATKEQLQSLKKNLQIMSDTVEKDEITWESLIPAISKLNNDISTYLKEINFNLTYEKLTRRSEWIFKNKDTIIRVRQNFFDFSFSLKINRFYLPTYIYP